MGWIDAYLASLKQSEMRIPKTQCIRVHDRRAKRRYFDQSEQAAKPLAPCCRQAEERILGVTLAFVALIIHTTTEVM